MISWYQLTHCDVEYKSFKFVTASDVNEDITLKGKTKDLTFKMVKMYIAQL